MNVLPQSEAVKIVRAVVEGLSIRATARLYNHHHNTVGRLLLRVGEGCAAMHDRLVRNVAAQRVQVDEVWTYCGKKKERVTVDDPPDVGDQWVWVALAWESRLAVSFLVDKRCQGAADALLTDLRTRVVGQPLISTDGFGAYPTAVAGAFGMAANHGVMNCEERPGDADTPPQRVKVRRVLMGEANPAHVTTAHIERSNLTLRMGSRRFTRRSNGYSKWLRHLRAAVALHYFHYNFCRVHETLGTTPAVKAGIASEVWSVGILISGAD